MPDVRIFTIGVVQLNENVELRCVREPWGWRPDLIVDHATRTANSPPECFRLRPELIEALDQALVGALNLN